MARRLGNTTIAVLEAISRGVRYGFDIMSETGLASGTVYPALSRLERLGHVTTAWEPQEEAQAEGRPPRKYYEVTPRGRDELRVAAQQIAELARMLEAGQRPRGSG